MGLFAGKTKQTQKKKNPLDVPKTAQESIPYLGVLENGVFQTDESHFSRMYKIPDMNFVIASTDKQKDILAKFMEFLGSSGPDVTLQQVIYNKSVKPAELEAEVLIRSRNDRLNEYRAEMNEMLIDKMSQAKNNILHEKYFIATIEAETSAEARSRFERMDAEIEKGFERITESRDRAYPLSLTDRLAVLFDIYNMESSVPFYRRVRLKDEKLMESFSMRHIRKLGLTSKDVIGPSALTFERDYMIVGETYARAMMVTDLPSYLRGDILTEIANMPFNLLVSVHYRTMAQDKAIRMLNNKLTDINANVSRQQQKASRKGYSADLINPEIKNASQEAENLILDLTQDNQKLFYVTVTATVFARDKETLDKNTETFQHAVERFVCRAKTLTTMQEAGLDTCLPLGVNRIRVERLLNTRSAAIFLPFSVKELWQKDGMYYGLNGISKQLLLYNRQSAINGNGCIFGSPGSGKSFSAKREIVNVLLRTDDDVFVIDPENEYGGLARLFYGSSIRIAPGADAHINPMDMGLDYSSEEGVDPVVMKANYIASICEAAAGSRYPLTPIQTSVIDRCVKNVYREYLDTLRAEGKNEDRSIVPTLMDFYHEVQLQPEPEAHNLALTLEKFVKGTQNVFAFRTNVDINNRFTVYNIKDMQGMMTVGLQICLDNVWNKMIENYKKGRRTWLYCDEFHLLAQTENSAKYTQQIWRRARKWNGIPTGITQQVEDLMRTADGRAIIDNSEFVMMLSMNAYGRAQMQKMYSLTSAEMEYITSSGCGHGLIYTGTDIIPFEDDFPKGTKLYQAMTTKAGEGEIRK